MSEAETGAEAPAQSWTKQLALVRRQAGLARLLGAAVVLLLGVFVARYSWQIPLVSDAERALYDIRLMLTTPRVEQDPRVLMVTYTDDTLINTQVRSPLDRKILADALRNLDKMGAKAIAIDVIVDQPTPSDDYLIDTFRAMRTPTYLAFTSAATNKRFIFSPLFAGETMPPRAGLQQARRARAVAPNAKRSALTGKQRGRLPVTNSPSAQPRRALGKFVTGNPRKPNGRKAPAVPNRTSGSRCLFRLALGGFGLFWVGALLLLLAQ